jgi:hypothetical protein
MNTMQQEFDAVVAHLYAQGRPAKAYTGHYGGKCSYRMEVDGKTLMCAVGCRIPDAVYVPAMDAGEGGLAAHALIASFGRVLPLEISEYHEMFGALQGVHDSDSHEADAFNFKVLERSLQRVANAFGLTFTVPQQGE